MWTNYRYLHTKKLLSTWLMLYVNSKIPHSNVGDMTTWLVWNVLLIPSSCVQKYQYISIKHNTCSLENSYQLHILVCIMPSSGSTELCKETMYFFVCNILEIQSQIFHNYILKFYISYKALWETSINNDGFGASWFILPTKCYMSCQIEKNRLGRAHDKHGGRGEVHTMFVWETWGKETTWKT